MLCVQENNKSTLEIQSNCHLFLKQCHLSRILYSLMLNPDVHVLENVQRQHWIVYLGPLRSAFLPSHCPTPSILLYRGANVTI